MTCTTLRGGSRVSIPRVETMGSVHKYRCRALRALLLTTQEPPSNPPAKEKQQRDPTDAPLQPQEALTGLLECRVPWVLGFRV